MWVLRWREGELNRSRTLGRTQQLGTAAEAQRAASRFTGDQQLNRGCSLWLIGEAPLARGDSRTPIHSGAPARRRSDDSADQSSDFKGLWPICGQEWAGLDDDREKMAESESVKIPHEYWRFIVFHRKYPRFYPHDRL